MVLAECDEEQTKKDWYEDGKAEGRAEMPQKLSAALNMPAQQLQDLLDAK